MNTATTQHATSIDDDVTLSHALGLPTKHERQEASASLIQASVRGMQARATVLHAFSQAVEAAVGAAGCDLTDRDDGSDCELDLPLPNTLRKSLSGTLAIQLQQHGDNAWHEREVAVEMSESPDSLEVYFLWIERAPDGTLH